MQWRQKPTSTKPQPRSRAGQPQPPRTALKKPSVTSTPTSPSPAPPPPPENEAKKKRGPSKLSRVVKPDDMTLEEWQCELRRQFGREQEFLLENVGEERIFSEFDVTNPQSQRTYRVHIRGTRPGDNYCACADFQTNTLGTCKHIEFTLAALERKRGGAAALKDGFQPEYSEVYLQYGARREVRLRLGAGCPAELARLAGRYFSDERFLLKDAFGRFETFLEEAGRFDHELRTHEDVVAFVAEVRDNEKRQLRVQEAFPRGSKSPAFRDLLKVPLYDYQREGALFAARSGRCLIGDEMGLGKTIQAIATAEIMARLYGVSRVLIICPTSLKHQWEREIQRFCERDVDVVSGWRVPRERHFAKPSFFKITNYNTIHRDLDLINTWSPELVILDEAQRIKNWETQTARSVKQIASPYALVLTGTPLENRLEELMSIVQFVDRFRLGPTFRLLDTHQVRDEWGKVVGYRELDRVGRTLEPILLRRHKDEVLDQLPKRIESNIFVPMTDRQRKFHNEALTIVAEIVEKWRRLGFLTDTDKQRLMIALQRMRMACDSSYLVDHRTDHGVKADEVMTLLGEMFETPGTKVVVFSQWLRMHELLVRRVKERKWGHVVFHGSVPSGKRGALIDTFREDPECRLFLSTDAGGTGLNLQHASVVINLDLPWNPAVLEQRIGRVHRLGQSQPVRVVNFVAQGTIEESMLEVLRFKKSLFSGVFDGGEKDVFMGGSRLNKFMEQVEKITTSIPAEMLEDAEEVLRRPGDEIGDGERVSTPPQTNGRGGRAGKTSPAPKGRSTAPGGAPGGRGSPETPPVSPGTGTGTGTGTTAPAPIPTGGDPWGGLLQMGMTLLQQFVGGATGGAPGTSEGAPRGGGSSGPRVVQDEQSGETYLRVPMPQPEVVEQALQAVSALLQSFRR